MYSALYSLLSDYIYGVDAVLTGEQTLTMTLICTIFVLVLISLPFIVVWRILKVFL